MKEIETTTAPRATPAEVFAIYRRLWGDRKPMTDNRKYALYDLRGEMLDRAVEAGISYDEVKASRQYREITEQIRLIESITPDSQAEYFARLTAELEADADWLDLHRTQEDARL